MPMRICESFWILLACSVMIPLGHAFAQATGQATGQATAQSLDQVKAGPFTFVFASVAQGREVLETPDDFVKQMSRFDRQVRMRSQKDPGQESLLKFVSAEVIEWRQPARLEYQAAIQSLDTALAKLNLPSPGPILLIRTTGREESGAAYTRGKSIVLPVVHRGQKDRLIAHELFHVISRNFPGLRDELYATIGFRKCPPVSLPASFAQRKVTNPDAPEIQHVIDVQLSDNQRVTVAPALYANRDYDAELKMSIFSNLETRLMQVVENREGRYVASMKDDQPVMYGLDLPDFVRQVGSNSPGNFHPEEIMANYFSRLVVEDGTGSDRRVIESMRKVFQQTSADSLKQ
jgi:hypothetical protein